METRYKLIFGLGSRRFEQILTWDEVRQGKGAYNNRKPTAMHESLGFGDKLNNELFENDMIINTFRNGGLPHRVEWDAEQGGWCGVYDGMKYLIGSERSEVLKVNP